MLSDEEVRSILEAARPGPGGFAELFRERRDSLRASLQEDLVRAASSGASAGCGVRVVDGGRTGFAYTTSFLRPAVLRAARDAAESARAGAPLRFPPARRASRPPAGETDALPAPRQAAAWLREARDAALRDDPRLEKAVVHLVCARRRFEVDRSDGARAAEEQAQARISVDVLARSGTEVRSSHAGSGASGTAFLPPGAAAATGREAARRALRLLQAREAPAGPWPVVMAPGDGAILFHEAVGHALEADIVQGGNSFFAPLLGAPVAAKGITLRDDPSVPGHGGSYAFDDEGTSARGTVLIEEGVLRGFLHDLISARRAGVPPTGNGRRQDFRHLPIPRMSNTLLAAGDRAPGEILASVPRGLYVRAVGAGQANANSGGFTFEVLDADWIENGALVHPVRNASLVGDALSVLKNLDMVGDDFAFGMDGGYCGKGQLVPVEGGMPTVRVKEMIVGGAKAPERAAAR